MKREEWESLYNLKVLNDQMLVDIRPTIHTETQ